MTLAMLRQNLNTKLDGNFLPRLGYSTRIEGNFGPYAFYHVLARCACRRGIKLYSACDHRLLLPINTQFCVKSASTLSDFPLCNLRFN